MSFGDGAFKNAALRPDPHSAAGQIDCDIGHDLSVRIRHETNEAAFGKHLPRHDATPLAQGARSVSFGLRQCHPGSTASSASTASGAGGSIQPAFTRASMMIAFASSAVRLNLSSPPGPRT